MLQVCYTKGVSAYLPAFLQGRTLLGLLSPPSALVEVVIDSDRHVLYTRSATSVIKVHAPVDQARLGPRVIEAAALVLFGRWFTMP